MATIFGNSVATGPFAKGSNEPLGTDTIDIEGRDEEDNIAATPVQATNGDNGASSSTTRPSKRAKVSEGEDTGLVGAFNCGCDRLAEAIEKGAAGIPLPPNLFQNIVSLPGFTDMHKSYFYADLVEKPVVASAFNDLPFDFKISWLAKFVAEKFPE